MSFYQISFFYNLEPGSCSLPDLVKSTTSEEKSIARGIQWFKILDHSCIKSRGVASNTYGCNYNYCYYILFTKLPRPEDSEGAFCFSSQVSTGLPHTVKASHCLFNC